MSGAHVSALVAKHRSMVEHLMMALGATVLLLPEPRHFSEYLAHLFNRFPLKNDSELVLSRLTLYRHQRRQFGANRYLLAPYSKLESDN